MESILDRISALLVPGVKYIQYVGKQNGSFNWQEAHKVSNLAGLDVDKELETATAIIKDGGMCEFFFRTQDDNWAFLNILYQPEYMPATDFAKIIFSNCHSLTQISFIDLINALESGLTGKQGLFFTDPTKIVLGVVDWWRVLGPAELWNASSGGAVTEESLLTAIGTNKNLLETDKNFHGVEFIYSGDVMHRIAFQASKAQDGLYKLDIKKVLGLISKLSA